MATTHAHLHGQLIRQMPRWFALWEPDALRCCEAFYKPHGAQLVPLQSAGLSLVQLLLVQLRVYSSVLAPVSLLPFLCDMPVEKKQLFFFPTSQFL